MKHRGSKARKIKNPSKQFFTKQSPMNQNREIVEKQHAADFYKNHQESKHVVSHDNHNQINNKLGHTQTDLLENKKTSKKR